MHALTHLSTQRHTSPPPQHTHPSTHRERQRHVHTSCSRRRFSGYMARSSSRAAAPAAPPGPSSKCEWCGGKGSPPPKARAGCWHGMAWQGWGGKMVDVSAPVVDAGLCI